jgi:hypothetical protein
MGQQSAFSPFPFPALFGRPRQADLRGQPFNMEDILFSQCRTAREIPAANIVNDRCSTQFQFSSHRSSKCLSSQQVSSNYKAY